MMRNTISSPKLGAMPQSSELMVNSRRQSRKNRFRPKTPASHPLMGRIMAFETRYDVSTQVLSSLLAPRLPAMCGSATLAMLVSSTSMNAAIATTMAISQGLNVGFQGASTMGAVSATSAIDSLDVDLGFDRHKIGRAH